MPLNRLPLPFHDKNMRGKEQGAARARAQGRTGSGKTVACPMAHGCSMHARILGIDKQRGMDIAALAVAGCRSAGWIDKATALK